MQRSGWGRSFGLLPYPRQGGIAAVWRRRCRCSPAGMPPPGGGGKRGIRHRMVSYPPLDSPSSSLGRDSLRSRVETGEMGLGSVRFSAYMWLSCPEFRLRGLPRIPVRGHSVQGGRVLLRKAPLPSRVYPWSTRRHCGPLAFRCATEGSRSAKEGKGSQEGTGNHTWCPVPFCPCRWAPTSLDRGDGQSHLQRCAAVSAEGLPSADGREKEGAPSFESARQVNR